METWKQIALAIGIVSGVFGGWLFIESRINSTVSETTNALEKKVDKDNFELRLEIKKNRIDTVEKMLEEKLKTVKENQARILEKLEGK